MLFPGQFASSYPIEFGANLVLELRLQLSDSRFNGQRPAGFYYEEFDCSGIAYLPYQNDNRMIFGIPIFSGTWRIAEDRTLWVGDPTSDREQVIEPYFYTRETGCGASGYTTPRAGYERAIPLVNLDELFPPPYEVRF